jgi:hypothetical protein
LTKLAKKFQGKADVTGVSVWERGNNQLGQVEKFVTQMGSQMDYNIAFDGAGEYMAKNWMIAAKRSGIPTAFVVKDGTVLWVGHPMGGLEDALAQITSGTFDINKAKRAEADQSSRINAARAQQAKMKPLLEAVQKKDYKRAEIEIDKLQKDGVIPESLAENLRLNMFVMQDNPKANAVALRVAKANRTNGPTLNRIAWSMVDPTLKRKNMDAKVALQIAKWAVDADSGRSAESQDTLAYAYFLTGEKQKAITTGQRALEIAKKGKLPANVTKEIEQHLSLFKTGR